MATERNNRVIELRRNGYSLRVIGKRVGISHEMVRRIVEAAGVQKGQDLTEAARITALEARLDELAKNKAA